MIFQRATAMNGFQPANVTMAMDGVNVNPTMSARNAINAVPVIMTFRIANVGYLKLYLFCVLLLNTLYSDHQSI